MTIYQPAINTNVAMFANLANVFFTFKYVMSMRREQ